MKACRGLARAVSLTGGLRMRFYYVSYYNGRPLSGNLAAEAFPAPDASGSCLGIAWEPPGICLETLWNLFGSSPKALLKLPGVFWELSGSSLGGPGFSAADNWMPFCYVSHCNG